MNLCVNARDAMTEGGRLFIEAENLEVDEHYANMNVGARPGRYVSISVSDSGVGIPDENLSKVFDPFFTTKGHGKGTGLGLSTVAAIVRSHGGFVSLYSEVGRGSHFKICLPAIESVQSPAIQSIRPDLPLGNGELILIVDDEAAIREIAREALETFGYSVLTASDGAEALALFAQRKDDVQCVITDMMMPFTGRRRDNSCASQAYSGPQDHRDERVERWRQIVGSGEVGGYHISSEAIYDGSSVEGRGGRAEALKRAKDRSPYSGSCGPL